jgi:hypothetical protein
VRRNSAAHPSRRMAAGSEARVVRRNGPEPSGPSQKCGDRKHSGKAGVVIEVPIQGILSFSFSAIRRNYPRAFLSRLLMNALGDLAAKIPGGCNRCSRATAVCSANPIGLRSGEAPLCWRLVTADPPKCAIQALSARPLKIRNCVYGETWHLRTRPRSFQTKPGP